MENHTATCAEHQPKPTALSSILLMAESRFATSAPSTLRVFKYIIDCVEDGKEFPSGRDISRAMGWKNAASSLDVISRLVVSGLVHRELAQIGGRKRYEYRVNYSGKPSIGELFKKGLDTLEIAQAFKVSEAEIYNKLAGET